MDKKIIRNLVLIPAACTLLAGSAAPVSAAKVPEFNKAKFERALQKLEQREEKAPIILSAKAELIVFVDGEQSPVLSDVYGAGQAVTITAPEVAGKTFSYWEMSSANVPRTKVSTKKEFTVLLNSDVSLYAVYEGASAQTAVASITSATPSIYCGSKSLALTVTRSVPAGKKVTAMGVLYTTNQRLGKEDAAEDASEGIADILKAGGKKVKKQEVKTKDSGDGDWTLYVGVKDTAMRYYAIGYAVVDGKTVYGEPVSLIYDTMKSTSATLDLEIAPTVSLGE